MKKEICKNCKWWGIHWDGVCDFVEIDYTDNPKTGFYIYASAIDDYGLETRLHTSPEFGCVNFQSRGRRNDDRDN